MRIVLALAILLLSTSLATAADDPPTRWMLAVASDRADGVTLVNGVPIHRFAKSGSGKENLSTASLPLAPWLVNGRNVIEVRIAKVAPGGKVGTQFVKSEAQFRDGTLEFVETPLTVAFEAAAEGLPRWRFLDAEPIGQDEAGLRKAVAALHAAVAKADTKTMMAVRKPYFDDLTRIYGAPPPDLEKQLAAELKQGKLRPLPAKLTVSTAHDGKVAIVETAEGTAPIRADAKDGHMELGQYWSKLDGKWLLIR